MPSSLTPEQWKSILELQGHEPCPGVASEFGHVLRTSGDFRQTATVFRPESPGTRRLPAVLAMHGGGFTSGNPDGVGMWAKYFAIALGLTTVSVSYRLGTPDRPTFPLPIGDGMDGLRWIRANAQTLGVDGERCFLVGDSAGACLCAMVAVLPGSSSAGDLARLGDLAGPLPLVAGLMALWGPMDFVARWFDNGGRPNAEPNLLGCNYPDNPALYHRASPVTYIRPGLPPAIFVYGNQDAVVPPSTRVARIGRMAGGREPLRTPDARPHRPWRDRRQPCQPPADAAATGRVLATSPESPQRHGLGAVRSRQLPAARAGRPGCRGGIGSGRAGRLSACLRRGSGTPAASTLPAARTSGAGRSVRHAH